MNYDDIQSRFYEMIRDSLTDRQFLIDNLMGRFGRYPKVIRYGGPCGDYSDMGRQLAFNSAPF